MGQGSVVVVLSKLITGSGILYVFLQVESQEISGTSLVSESTISENDSARVAKPMVQSVPSMSFSEAQRLISLFFALCTKVCIAENLELDNDYIDDYSSSVGVTLMQF